MGKRKRAKSRNQRSRGRTKPQQGPVVFQHPLAQIPDEQLRSALIKLAKRSKVELQESLRTVLEILSSHEPLQTIATLATFGLCGHLGDDGKQTAFFDGKRLTQAHVELLQALSLTIPLGEHSLPPPSGGVIQSLFDLLPEISNQFASQRMVAFEQERSDEQEGIGLLQESLRLHTQSVRNWGYFDSVVRVVNDLYKPIDEGFKLHVGLSATQVVACFVQLLRQSERKITALMQQLGRAFAQKTIDGMIRKYYAVYPNPEESPEKLISLVRQKQLNLWQVKVLLLSYVEYQLPRIYEFSAENIAAMLGQVEPRAAEVLDKLSLAFGDLAGGELAHFFLFNPIWTKPLIRIGEGRYFCAVPQMFFSFIRPVLDGLITDDNLLQQSKRRRAEFLETELNRLFANAFPDAEIVANFRWKDGETEYENDLLVRVDSYLLIIEAKSGTVSWSALRGARERAKKHIRELLVDPSLQSARLAERLKTAIKSPELRNLLLAGLNLRLDPVRTVLRLSVTLEDFAMIQSNLGELRRTGWLPPDHSVAPCLLLTDLQVVFDILEPAGQKLHYLCRRTELAARTHIMGDELDHLGFYLDKGFNIGDAEFSGATIQLVEMSKKIDDFCIARAEGIQIKKPRLRLSKWWSDICAKVEGRAFRGWTDVYNLLLSLSPDEQEKMERMFNQLAGRLRRRQSGMARKDFVLFVPPPQKSVAVALYAFRDTASHQRHDSIMSVAEKSFEHPHVERCLVIATNLDRKTYPYGTLAVLSRGATSHAVDELVVY